MIEICLLSSEHTPRALPVLAHHASWFTSLLAAQRGAMTKGQSRRPGANERQKEISIGLGIVLNRGKPSFGQTGRAVVEPPCRRPSTLMVRCSAAHDPD